VSAISGEQLKAASASRRFWLLTALLAGMTHPASWTCSLVVVPALSGICRRQQAPNCRRDAPA